MLLSAAPCFAQSMQLGQGHAGDCVGCHGKHDTNRYRFEPGQSRIAFSIDAFGFARVTGEFLAVDGGFRFDPDAPEKGAVVASVRSAEVRTGDALTTAVVRERFFEAEKYPLIAFTGSNVTRTGANTGRIDGKLELLGVLRPMSLDVNFLKLGVHPITDDTVAGFTARTTFKRSDFGMELGLPGIADEVDIAIEVIGKRLD
jgi:polyisoprenoid-binding protein YceI